MAERKHKAYEENAPGDFYVEKDLCITCRAPENVAPGLIGYCDDISGAKGHCYFRKQPETEQEIAEAVKAISMNCCGSYRYSGSDPRIKDMLREDGCEDAIETSD